MHIHILGICGTFMGGLALLARAAGHRVTGCDAGVYPPMSTQLEEQGIALVSGYDPGQLALAPDVFVVGNAVTRGNPLMEAILDAGLPYTSGPQWLSEHILAGRHVLAVAGTHGKTTTTAMLAWILEQAGLAPSFLVGGVPHDFGVSARLLPSDTAPQVDGRPLFVIEADEYDTAFFDKRSKFVHYRPRTAILNNLEFDHADIFADLAAIETQFHHLVRTIPRPGRIVLPAGCAPLDRVLARECWSETVYTGPQGTWQAGPDDGSGFEVLVNGASAGHVQWALQGEHNRMNALAALAAAQHVGVSPTDGVRALGTFGGVKRRMELRGTVNTIRVYDDFAHHPTAIATTLEGLRNRLTEGRILAVLEPRSNTMKLGAMRAQLPVSLEAADAVFCFGASAGKHALGWDLGAALAPLGERAQAFHDLEALVASVVQAARPGDHIVVMSNGGFGGIHDTLLAALAKQAA